MRKTILVAALAGLQLSAFAQAWPQQPSAVLGIALGAPIDQAGIPGCQGASLSMCIEPRMSYMPDDVIRRVRGVPDLGFLYSVNLHLFSSRIEDVTLETQRDNFRALKSMLVEKYGAPAKDEMTQVTTGAGAVLGSEELTWIGPDVLISLRERARQANLSSVSFESRAVIHQRMEADTKKAAGAASKL